MCSIRHAILLQAVVEDPVNCTLATLRLTEKDSGAFEAAYRLVLEAAKAGSLGPGHLFTLAKYLCARGCLLWALPLAIHAMRLFSLNALQVSVRYCSLMINNDSDSAVYVSTLITLCKWGFAQQ